MYVEKKCKQLNYDGSECDLRVALILQKSSIFRIQKGFYLILVLRCCESGRDLDGERE